MPGSNGDNFGDQLYVGETLQVQMDDGSTLEYEVRAILENQETQARYAVLERNSDDEAGELILTDIHGNLVEDQDEVSDVLDNWLTFEEEAADREGDGN